MLDTLIEFYHMGLMNHLSIYKNITDEEMGHYIKLGVTLVGKKKQNNISLTADNALDLIFNGYSGNTIRKAIDRVMEQKSNSANRDGEASALPPASE